MNLILIGQRACGKTTAGRLLAQKLNAPFLDIDEAVESAEGRSILNIFESQGEAAFREAERRELEKAMALTHAVISVGGGAPLNPLNRRSLRQGGKVVWLDAKPKTLIARRDKDKKRPPLTPLSLEQEITNLYHERRPAYEDAAHLRLEIDEKSIEEVVVELERIWRTL